MDLVSIASSALLSSKNAFCCYLFTANKYFRFHKFYIIILKFREQPLGGDRTGLYLSLAPTNL